MVRSFRIGLLAPAVLLALALLDASSRWVPIDVFAFRAWETMVAEPAPTGPFAASKSFYNPWSYGDLSSLGNFPALREYRSERFTTDKWGFRNPPALAEGAAVGMLFLGDSFGAGAGNSDEDTLPAQLGQRLGSPVYNLSGGPLARLADIRRLAQALKFKAGVLVYEIFERNGPPAITTPTDAMFKPPTSGAEPSGIERVEARVTNLKISRLEILVSKWKRAGLAWWRGELPSSNPDVVATTLRDGSSMLFLRHEIGIVTADRPFPIDYFVWLREELSRDHLDVVVALVPSKFTVYSAMVAEPALPSPTSAVLARAAGELEGRGVRAVDLTPALVRAAASEYQQGRLLYWRDDTHWNAKGIRVAADEIFSRLTLQERAPQTNE